MKCFICTFFLLINNNINNNEESYLDDKWIVLLLLRLFEMYTKKNKDEIEETRKKNKQYESCSMSSQNCHYAMLFLLLYIFIIFRPQINRKKKRKESKHVKW